MLHMLSDATSLSAPLTLYSAIPRHLILSFTFVHSTFQNKIKIGSLHFLCSWAHPLKRWALDAHAYCFTHAFFWFGYWAKLSCLTYELMPIYRRGQTYFLKPSLMRPGPECWGLLTVASMPLISVTRLYSTTRVLPDQLASIANHPQPITYPLLTTSVDC